MTPDQALVLYAVAAASRGHVDHALSVLIEEGLLDPDQHIESADWTQALDDVDAEMEGS